MRERIRRALAPVPPGELPGLAGTLRVLVFLLVLAAMLVAWFLPFVLILTPGDVPLLVRFGAVALSSPLLLLLGIAIAGLGHAVGTEHPWLLRRIVASGLVGYGFAPWLLIVALVMGLKSLHEDPFGRTPVAPDPWEAGTGLG